MRYVTALYDAPIPAAAALQALRDAGFAAADIATAPQPPTSSWPPSDEQVADLPTDDEPRLARALCDLGIDEEQAALYAEGVGRGALLIAVRTPTLSAGPAADALVSAGPPSLDEHQSRWAEDHSLRYRWAEVEPPQVDPPAGYHAGPATPASPSPARPPADPD